MEIEPYDRSNIGVLAFFATRNIRKGEELLWDYGKLYHDGKKQTTEIQSVGTGTAVATESSDERLELVQQSTTGPNLVREQHYFDSNLGTKHTVKKINRGQQKKERPRRKQSVVTTNSNKMRTVCDKDKAQNVKTTCYNSKDQGKPKEGPTEGKPETEISVFERFVLSSDVPILFQSHSYKETQVNSGPLFSNIPEENLFLALFDKKVEQTNIKPLIGVYGIIGAMKKLFKGINFVSCPDLPFATDTFGVLKSIFAKQGTYLITYEIELQKDVLETVQKWAVWDSFRSRLSFGLKGADDKWNPHHVSTENRTNQNSIKTILMKMGASRIVEVQLLKFSHAR